MHQKRMPTSFKAAAIIAMLAPAGIVPPTASAESAQKRSAESTIMAAKAHRLGKQVLELYRKARKTKNAQATVDTYATGMREVTVVKELPGANSGDKFTYQISAIMGRTKSGELLPNTTVAVGGTVYSKPATSSHSTLSQSFNIRSEQATGPYNLHGWVADSSRVDTDGSAFTVATDSSVATTAAFKPDQFGIIVNDVEDAIDVVAGTSRDG